MEKTDHAARNGSLFSEEKEMTSRYFIVKSTRLHEEPPGYDGVSCLYAGVPRAGLYETREEAQIDADKLTVVNIVGFEVKETVDHNTEVDEQAWADGPYGRIS